MNCGLDSVARFDRPIQKWQCELGFSKSRISDQILKRESPSPSKPNSNSHESRVTNHESQSPVTSHCRTPRHRHIHRHGGITRHRRHSGQIRVHPQLPFAIEFQRSRAQRFRHFGNVGMRHFCGIEFPNRVRAAEFGDFADPCRAQQGLVIGRGNFAARIASKLASFL